MKILHKYLTSLTLLLFLLTLTFITLLPSQFNTDFKGNSDSNPKYYVLTDNSRTFWTKDELPTVFSPAHANHLHRNKSTVNPIATRKEKHLSREEKLERGLAQARASIRRAATAAYRRNNLSLASTHKDGDDYIPAGDVHRNPGLFYQSYLEMEKRFKVYVYPDGELPISHDGPCKEMYSIEGRFINELEHGSGKFRTHDAHEAHIYFLPFSVALMVKYLYVPDTYDATPLRRYVSDYVRIISSKYPFWNRTQGADHFMLACHDWGPYASRANPFLYNTSIRVLCNANTTEGFNPQKDVSLSEIHLRGGKVPPKLLSPPADNASRPHLAFFAGGMHGPIRPILLRLWKNRYQDMPIYEYLPKGLDYYSFMLNSKFCLCPSGYEVASPRIMEAIYAECVPVILSKNYTLPFSDVLRWDGFSILVDVIDIPRLKEVLSAVSEEKYRKLKEGVRIVRRHFTLNHPPKMFDAYHMILHSIWLRRLNVRLF